MFSAKRIHMLYVKRVPFYLKEEDGSFITFKEPGITIKDMGVNPADLPARIYVMPQDRPQAIKEIQSGLNKELVNKFQTNDLIQIKDLLNDILEVTFSEVTPAGLENLNQTVDMLRQQYHDDPSIIRSMAMVGKTDHTTVMHSLNVMCLTLSFCSFHKMSVDRSRTLGLAALLHDVGKTEIDPAILSAPRQLTEEEFAQIRQHPTLGYRILNRCLFQDKVIPLVAMQHHEKIDGSGYPKGLDDISPAGRLVAIIDCYEAITADDRPYRSAARPFDALSLIREEVNRQKFDRRLFEQFIASLS